MDHDWPTWRLVRGLVVVIGSPVLQIESFGKLEIELNGSALERAMKSVLNSDVDLWSIESTIARVQLPFTRVIFI